MLPYLPLKVSFADMGGIESIRKTVTAQMEEGFKAGIFKAPDLTGIIKERVQIPTRDGASLGGVVYRPESGVKGPLLVFYHGGGFVSGFPETFEPEAELLTKELGVTVLGVAYRVAPENIFPTAVNDAVDSLKWQPLGADPSKGFIVAGSSAGGNLAAGAARNSIDSNLSPPLTGVFLNVPLLVHPTAVPEKFKPHYNSEEEFKDGMILDRRGMQDSSLIVADAYQWDPTSKEASPLLWPKGSKPHPPTYIQVCGADPLRDDGLIYESILREEGVPTRLDVYPGLPHGSLNFMPMLSQSKKALVDVKDGVQWILNQKA
ncbi:alpha/beta-hydrolase [Pleomassaria siparia CBS 279.74]|uniref:Alpha/beta-hydrolase n=1 Tax=Pleomassaria siparia CBS 279.74 TaxID=1314801 RepID=A0A6G1JY81_9PLEO|nr:alpha/beta-hydrolase [Pleomassaria siparia CBS 279.74]